MIWLKHETKTTIWLKPQTPLTCLYNRASRASRRMILGEHWSLCRETKHGLHQVNHGLGWAVLSFLPTLVILSMHFEKLLWPPRCSWGALTEECPRWSRGLKISFRNHVGRDNFRWEMLIFYKLAVRLGAYWVPCAHWFSKDDSPQCPSF